MGVEGMLLLPAAPMLDPVVLAGAVDPMELVLVGAMVGAVEGAMLLPAAPMPMESVLAGVAGGIDSSSFLPQPISNDAVIAQHNREKLVRIFISYVSLKEQWALYTDLPRNPLSFRMEKRWIPKGLFTSHLGVTAVGVTLARAV